MWRKRYNFGGLSDCKTTFLSHLLVRIEKQIDKIFSQQIFVVNNARFCIAFSSREKVFRNLMSFRYGKLLESHLLSQRA